MSYSPTHNQYPLHQNHNHNLNHNLNLNQNINQNQIINQNQNMLQSQNQNQSQTQNQNQNQNQTQTQNQNHYNLNQHQLPGSSSAFSSSLHNNHFNNNHFNYPIIHQRQLSNQANSSSIDHNHILPSASLPHSQTEPTNFYNQNSLYNYNNNLNQISSLNQSSDLSDSKPPSSEHYYASRSASGASENNPLSQNNHIQIGFRRLIRGPADLHPRINITPAHRRMNPFDGSYISPLKSLTIHLAETYRLVNPNFRYELSLNPRRVLTKPSKPAANNGLDNEDSDYILYVNDILGGSNQLERDPSSQIDPSNPDLNHIRSGSGSTSGPGSGHKYLILDVLGQGTFGQVVKCQDMKTHEFVAVKVVKNKQAYFSQSMMEVTILELLNNTWDVENKHHILRMKDTFIHHNHLCLVFELLSSNLYELIKQNSFRGLSTSLVRVFTNQLLDALTVLNEAHLIHCDLKPENILLTSLQSPEIKVIDFGSACHERQTVYTYIQSRFYRSPEVILGLPYSSAIDMWSLGCICVELFLGLPLFPGTSEYNQITRIVEMLGMPPTYMLEVGRQTLQFFDVMEDDFNGGRKVYKLKSLEQYSKEHNVQEQPSKRYFQQHTLEDIISQYPVIRKGMKPADLEKEKQNRIAFIDFVKGLLNIDPLQRWSPQQARLHPFILGEPLREPYVPMKSYGAPNSGTGAGANRLGEVNQVKGGHSSSGHGPMDSQPSQQPPGSTGNHGGAGAGPSETSVKRPYGGLPAAPVRSGQKVYDAAAYSQLQAQQQAINAQAAALRQHQAQAAQQSQNPYAIPQDTRPSLAQQTVQPGNHGPANTHQLQHQYSSNRLQLAHPPTLASAASAGAIGMPHSYYSTRGAAGIGGPPTAGSLPNTQLSMMPQSQIMYNAHLPTLGSSSTTGPAPGRQRSGTLDQMDLVPPQLQKVQVDLNNYGGGHSVTPVLRRDDQYLAWEQRQQAGPNTGTGSGVGAGGLNRRASYRSNPQLEYLHEQAESSDGWTRAPRYGSGAGAGGGGSTSHYGTQQQQQQQQYGGPPKPSVPAYETVVIDGYDHRDGGQALAYVPMVPKATTSGGGVRGDDGGGGARVMK